MSELISGPYVWPGSTRRDSEGRKVLVLPGGSDGSTAASQVVGGSAGRFLRDNGTTGAWSTSTIPDTFARGDIVRASASNVLTALTIGAANRVLTSDGTDPQWSASIAYSALAGSATGTAGNWASSGVSLAATGYTGQNLGGTVRAFTVANNSSSPPAYQMHYNSDSISAGTEVGGIEQWAGSATPKKICRIAFVNVDTGEDDGTIRFFTAVASVLTDRGEMDNAGKFLWRGELEIDGALNHDGSTVGLYGVTPVSRAAAMAQTYSTADRTHAARTASTLTDNTTGTPGTTLAALPTLTDTPASADALRDDIMTNWAPVLRNWIASLADQHNKSKADSDDSAQFLNSLVDDTQAIGINQ